jgi:hypothetical protein
MCRAHAIHSIAFTAQSILVLAVALTRSDSRSVAFTAQSILIAFSLRSGAPTLSPSRHRAVSFCRAHVAQSILVLVALMRSNSAASTAQSILILVALLRSNSVAFAAQSILMLVALMRSNSAASTAQHSHSCRAHALQLCRLHGTEHSRPCCRAHALRP